VSAALQRPEDGRGDSILKNIHPLSGPELLRVLAEKGRGDAIMVADAGFIERRPEASRPLLRLAKGVITADDC
jgi:L-fucose mutarotase/ribose pyranase (RbsD/FucU family)